MNTENSKTDESNKFIYRFTDQRNLKSSNNKYIGSVNLSSYYTWRNIKSAYNSNKFKVSAPTWNDGFDLPDGSNSITDIQDYFKFTIKNMKLRLKIHPYKFISIELKIGLFLKLLSPEIMKLLGSLKKDADKDKDGEDVPKLESVEVILLQYNLVNNSYQQALKYCLLLYLINNLVS